MHDRGKLIPAQLGVVIGTGLLSAGAVTHHAYLAAAGVVIAVLSLVWAVVSWRRYVAGIPGRGFQGDEARQARVRADQAGPDDGANGTTLASPPEGDRQMFPQLIAGSAEEERKTYPVNAMTATRTETGPGRLSHAHDQASEVQRPSQRGIPRSAAKAQLEDQ
jgi:hypothetical protein